MGQTITIDSRTIDGMVAAFHTDRSITGQDGAVFESAQAATDAGSLPGDLAARLFESDSAVNHVFVASNQVVVRRPGGWDDSSVATARGVIERFFVFYVDA